MSQAYIARVPPGAAGVLATVNIAASPELWSMTDVYATEGIPVDVLAHRFSASRVVAYVTSVGCLQDGFLLGGMAMGGMTAMGPGGPPPCPISGCDDGGGGGGGGGGAFTGRRVWLTAIDVTDPSVPAGQTVLLSETPSITCDSFTAFDNIGMALTADGNKLFIANPAKDRVEVFDTNTNTLGMAISLTGTMPMDVAVVQQAGALGVEVAYVVNRESQNISVIRVSTLQEIEIIELVDPGPPVPNIQPVAVAALSDGTKLFTADSLSGGVSVIIIDTQDEDNFHTKIATIPAGEDVRRVVLLAVPE